MNKIDEKVMVTEDGKLTEDGIEVLENTLNEVQSEDSKFIASLPSNSGVDEAPVNPELELESETAISVIDPNTGKIIHTSPDDIEYIDDLDETVKMVKEDLTTFTITEENIKDALKEQFPDEKISESAIKELTIVVNKFNKKEKMSYYNALPDEIKKFINKELSDYGLANNKQAKIEYTKSVLQSILFSSYINQQLIDMDHAINNTLNEVKDDVSKEYGLYSAKQRYNIEVKMLEVAKEKEESDPEKAKLLRDISAAFTQSYTYENMMNEYRQSPGKFKIKKIELEKFGTRLAMGFNNKYKNSKFTIRNIESIIPILKRWLPGIEEEKIKIFVAIFIKYTINMKPENLPEHVFMYYFINNIINLDYSGADEDNIKFNMTIIENIRSILQEI